MQNVYHTNVVVTFNKYATDTVREVEYAKRLTEQYAKVVVNDVWAMGGDGALELAEEVMKECKKSTKKFAFAYDLNDNVKQKIKDIVTKIYGGKGVRYSEKAEKKLKIIKKLGLEDLPIIIAKTQYSLSDNKNLLGAPTDFEVSVDDIEIKTGANFLVVLCGSMLLMPGLPKTPASVNMTIDKNGNIDGLY